MKRVLLLTALACAVLTFKASASGGLNYSYYEGNWSTLPDFGTLTATKTGTSTNLDLGVRGRDTYFGMLWQGFITIPADGVYTFELNSDDGSKLYIGNYNNTSTALVSNDGLHASQIGKGTQYLYKGVFPIAITFFQATGGLTMELYWSSTTGVSRQRVPDNVLSSNYTGVVTSFSGLNYSYVEGAYNKLPDFYTQTKIKTGNASNINLNLRNRDDQFALLWEGFINIPADGTYTFETNSDDGSKVYIGPYNNGISPLINNDGDHAPQIRKGTMYMSAGVYPITVSFYENAGGQTMELYWSSNTGIARQLVPDNAFKSSTSTSGSGTTSTGTTVNYKYYEGSYSTIPDVTTLTPVKTGTSNNFDVSVRNRNTDYLFMWQTNITVPTAGTYTFETNSDDGSKLYLGTFNSTATPLVNNDGAHSSQIRTGSRTLTAGVYTMTVLFAQVSGGQVMEAYWSSNAGLARQLIPDNVLSSFNGTYVGDPATPPATGGTGGLTGNTNYYFSSSTGDDSRTNAQAQNPATPWKTIDKLNSIVPSLASGDAVLLKRGDVFNGAISIRRTSGQTNAVIISAYGSGNKPVVSGFATLGNWVNLGNSIWSSYYNYTGASRINVVTINGQSKRMGRFPNADAASKGYQTYDSHTFDGGSLTGSITDSKLNTSVNWVGGELAIRKRHWVIDKGTITAQSGNTFSYKSGSSYPGIDGFGYFIQNHPKTLDQFGEWYYDPSSKYLQVHLGTNSPTDFEIKESVIDNLLYVLGQSNITVDNLSFQGANDKAVYIASSNNIKITNCDINASGQRGIDANYTNNLNIENCTVSNTGNDAMYLAPSITNSLIRYNKVTSTGLFAGMGSNSEDALQGITIDGQSDILEYNEVDSTGYTAIKFHGNTMTVRNNLVNTYCVVTDDGSGIYTYAGGQSGRKIQNNIIVNGVGAPDGTYPYNDPLTNGVFLDDLANDVEVSGNSISRANGRGIGPHNAHEVTITGNTVYDCDQGHIEFNHDVLGPNDPIRNVTMTNNIFVAKKADQDVMAVRTKDDDVAQMGTFDNNYYCRPLNDKNTFRTFTYFNTPSVITRTFNLQHWISTYGYDRNSKKSPVSIAPYTIGSVSGNMITNGSFASNVKYTQTPTGDRTVLQYDTYGLDGGDLKVSFTGNSSNQYQSIQYYESSTPTLQSGHTYRVKFSARAGSDNNTDFYCSFLGAYGVGRTDAKPFKVDNNRNEIELFFTPTTNVVNPYFEIYTQNTTECPVYWLDNLTLQEVYSMTATNPDDYLRFEYNATTSAKTVTLDGTYVDMKNTTYSNSVTLNPYTSVILVKTGSAQVSAASANLTAAVVQEMAAPAAPVGAFDLTIMPNPAADRIQLTLRTPRTDAGKASIVIYAASGTVVSSREITATDGPLTIDVSALSKGVYTVKVVYGKQVLSKRFVKM